jgi:dihydrofolate reductase
MVPQADLAADLVQTRRREVRRPTEPNRLKRGSIISTAETTQSIHTTQMPDMERQTAAGKVLWHFTMSLDGFVAGPNHTMDWMTGITHRAGLVEEYTETTGAVLGGRDGFDAYPDVRGIYGGAWQGPVFVLTHHPEDAQPADGVIFLSGDVAEAVRIGLEAAAGKNLEVFSPTIGRQLLERGLIDEIDLHIAPVLLGDGIRLFDNSGGVPVRLELRNGDDPTAAVNLRYHPVTTR